MVEEFAVTPAITAVAVHTQQLRLSDGPHPSHIHLQNLHKITFTLKSCNHQTFTCCLQVMLTKNTVNRKLEILLIRMHIICVNLEISPIYTYKGEIKMLKFSNIVYTLKIFLKHH